MTTDSIGTELAHELGEDGVLVVGVRDGDVRVRGVDGPTAIVRARDGGPLGGLEVERGERSLTIRSVRPGFPGRSSANPDLELEVPRGASVVIEAASADLHADGLLGDQRFRTASGDVTVRGLGGRLFVEAMSGDVDVTVAGSVAFDGRTVSGDMTLRAGTIERLRAGTTSGDLTVAGRFADGGAFTLETVSGDATLAPTDASLRIDVRTITGDLRSTLPHRTEGSPGHRSLIIGRGGPTVTVRTTSGDVRVVGETAPEGEAPGGTAATESGPTQDAPPTHAPVDDADPALSVLEALERGEIDVDDARRRLAALDAQEETRDVG